jgi:hypothetical protein
VTATPVEDGPVLVPVTPRAAERMAYIRMVLIQALEHAADPTLDPEERVQTTAYLKQELSGGGDAHRDPTLAFLGLDGRPVHQVPVAVLALVDRGNAIDAAMAAKRSQHQIAALAGTTQSAVSQARTRARRARLQYGV